MSEIFPPSSPPNAATPPPPASEPETLYCANHPGVETGLRCNNCNKPICAKCARRTPTGYRCKECISGQQKAFDTTQWYDYPIAFVMAGMLSALASLLCSWLGPFVFFLAPVAGVIIGEAVRLVTRRRRSPLLYKVAIAGIVLGALPVVLTSLVFFFALQESPAGLLRLVWQAVYVLLASSSAYYRLSGLSFNRR